VLNNTGSIFLEIIASLMVFFILGVSSLTILQSETNQTSEALLEWQAFWALQKTAERWKAGELISSFEDIPAGFEMEFHETHISPRIQEGEFIIRWKAMGVEKERNGYAYRVAIPLSNF
jgi:hypothetical protein